MRKALLACTAGLLACCATMAAAEEPLAIYGNRQTIELAPVLIAAKAYDPESGDVVMGGVPNLVGEVGAQGFSDPGAADVATNAETQLLRFSVKHPDLRIIAGVSEGLYRIVARRSAGIGSVADLKGKRVATIGPTSAGYFLQRMLEREGLAIGDVQIVPLLPLAKMTEALAAGEVDAVSIWEPEGQNAADVLGADLVEFSGEGVYRELFNLNSTAGKLADPVKRTRIVRFVRALIDALPGIETDPATAQALVVATSRFTAADVAASWSHHRFGAALPTDLLEVLEAEEKWLATLDKRPARSRAQLAGLIDTSVYAEALALGEQP